MKIAKWIAALLIFVLVQAPLSFSQLSSILINEFIPNPTGSDTAAKPEGEWVELYNPTSGDLDVSGWVLKDDYDTHILEIGSDNTDTSGTIVESKNYLVVYRDGDGDFSLNQSEDRVRLFDDNDNLIDSVLYSGSIEEGKSWSLIGVEWVCGTDPTPGAENSFPTGGTDKQQQQQEPQATISFSAPSSVAVDTPFSVSVTLKNFKPGTYALKVLIGKGGRFIYGNTKGASGWLTQNGEWAEMPRIAIGSTGNKTIQAKTDEDAAAGNYLITVSVAEKKGDGSFESLWKISDLPTKPLKVIGATESGSVSGEGSASKLIDEEGAEPVLAGVAEDEGEVLGEGTPQKEGPKLNFYIILGIFGMLVGSGGLILAFRRGRIHPHT